MALLVSDCPRCGAKKITFDVLNDIHTYVKRSNRFQALELFAVCRSCARPTIFGVEQKVGEPKGPFAKPGELTKFQGGINDLVEIRGYVNIRDMNAEKAPEFAEGDVAAAFNEGATCLATECWNAAGTMFRLAVDLLTRPLLPVDNNAGPNAKVRRDLGLRLPWLFDNKLLPEDLRELSHCIKEDGNDGAHQGTLTKEDAEDLLDFTRALLERTVTEPMRIKLAKERREKRRSK